MLYIKEYAYNACERNGMLESCDTFFSGLSCLEQRYTWIYLGFEFCENMMTVCRIDQTEKKIKEAVKRGYKIAFVLPVMHQNRVELFRAWIRAMKKTNLISEWIVNDIGTFALLDMEGISEGLVFGRMFEKATREVRQNILEIPEIEQHFELLQPLESYLELCRMMKKKYKICGAEIDTFPDGILRLRDIGLQYRVHYPDIYLSSSPYCEYANMSDEEKECFILHQTCKAECCIYEQKIAASNKRFFYKTGNVMLCRQERAAEDCIDGYCRLVYSDRIHEKHEKEQTD